MISLSCCFSCSKSNLIARIFTVCFVTTLHLSTVQKEMAQFYRRNNFHCITHAPWPSSPFIGYIKYKQPILQLMPHFGYRPFYCIGHLYTSQCMQVSKCSCGYAPKLYWLVTSCNCVVIIQ